MGPIIGILTRSGVNENGTPIEYCMESTRRSIVKAGGVPIMLTAPQDIDYFTTKSSEMPDLTIMEQEMVLYQIEKLGGLFIPGGNKITKYDYFVLAECLKRNIPVLGVCLGMQMIANYKVDNFKLLDVVNKNIHYKEDSKSNAHNVTIYKNSLLYKILNKEEIEVNSHHLRCVDYPKECTVTAKSPDGVIEAVELNNYDFCLGVQWHPEIIIDDDINSKKLLKYFVNKAKDREKIKTLKIKNI
mgnify:CR=1 FL=1